MGDDASAWPGLLASSTKEAHAAVAHPGAVDRTVHLSFGDTSGQEYVVQLTADLAIHAWDLARATGQDDTLDLGAAALLLPWAEANAGLLTHRACSAHQSTPGPIPPMTSACRACSAAGPERLARNRPGRGPGATRLQAHHNERRRAGQLTQITQSGLQIRQSD
jgi:hypothetical protein